MKKLFSFCVLLAAALGMTSCDKDGNVAFLKNFQIDVDRVDETSITVTVTANDPEKYFYYEIKTAEEFINIKNKEAVAGEPKERTYRYPSDFAQDKSTGTFRGLEPNTNYAIYVFYVDENCELVDVVEYKFVKTLAREVPDVQSPKFSVNFTDRYETSIKATITPKDPQMQYFYYMTGLSEYNENKAEVENFVKNATQTVGEEHFLKGNQTITLQTVTPNYYGKLFLGEVDNDKNIVGELESFTFATSKQ